MTRPSTVTAKSFVIIGIALSAPVGAQPAPDGLEALVAAIQEAWLAHDARAVTRRSDTLRLQLPGFGRAPAMRPSQAARVLTEYLRSANEITFDVRAIRPVSDDHAYAEVVRVYVVQGTADQRVETVLLGFRRVAGEWVLREVRITP